MTHGVGAAGAATLESGIARIRERFILGLEDREDEFLDYLEIVDDPAQSENAINNIRAKAHKLHGLAGTVGFARLGSLAAQLENHIDLLLAGPRPLEVGFAKELLDALLDEIETILKSG